MKSGTNSNTKNYERAGNCIQQVRFHNKEERKMIFRKIKHNCPCACGRCDTAGFEYIWLEEEKMKKPLCDSWIKTREVSKSGFVTCDLNKGHKGNHRASPWWEWTDEEKEK